MSRLIHFLTPSLSTRPPPVKKIAGYQFHFALSILHFLFCMFRFTCFIWLAYGTLLIFACHFCLFCLSSILHFFEIEIEDEDEDDGDDEDDDDDDDGDEEDV